MKKRSFFFTLCTLLAAQFVQAQSSAAIREYISKYKDAAISEMIRSGVPASITLAQGIHETDAGTSTLCLKSNNHFGIKCKKEWSGESVSHDDDAKGECFRKYETALDSYRDHSDFLRNRSHYAFLFELNPMDYEAWAWGLKKAGYATNPKYPQILIRLINDFNLQDYTLIALGRKQDNTPVGASADVLVTVSDKGAPDETGSASIVKKANYPQGVFKINETSVVYVPGGTSFLALAEEHRIPLARLFDFNDMQPQEAVTEGALVYLQRKRKTGANETHIVAPGETLHGIAQAEGLRIENLLEYNHLRKGMQPAVGAVLYLRKEAPEMPRLTFAIQSKVAASATIIKGKINTETTKDLSEEFIVHVVQPKETVYSIAKRYAVEINDVVKWNDLPGTSVKTGQQLRIKKRA